MVVQQNPQAICQVVEKTGEELNTERWQANLPPDQTLFFVLDN
jgi:hypothetical protein